MSFAVLVLSSAICAEVNSFNVKEITGEYSDLITKLITDIADGRVKYNDIEVLDPKYFNEDYTTKQYIPYEGILSTPEAKTTKGYYELKINVPAGTRVLDYGSIFMIINGKEVRFELDHSVKLNGDNNSVVIDYDKSGFPVLAEDATITLKYSPRYFELVPHVYYTPSTRTSKVKYNGKDILLEVKTYAALEFGNISLVLKPNLQNIYNDFAFVRK